MGKTIRRFERGYSKEPKKKDKYKVEDAYKGMSSEDIYEDEDIADNWYEFEEE